jgi:RNA polymerase sigma factor (TIGR02999 family)
MLSVKSEGSFVAWQALTGVRFRRMAQLQFGRRFGNLIPPHCREPRMESEEPELSEPDPGAPDANARLFASLYRELRQLAERQLRRNASASISPTTLLHEAYLGIAGRSAIFPDRERFLGYAARVMRGLIIDFVRERRALKRGAEFHITQLPGEMAQVDETELTRLSDALDELAIHDPRLAEVVDLRYFCGFTFEDIAAQRGTSMRTVQRDWEKARVLLFQGLQDSA